jgi:phenylacetate-CoA ligase
MNTREAIHRLWRASKGSHLYRHSDLYLRQYHSEIPENFTTRALSEVLRHAISQVPFYSQFAPLSAAEAPFELLRALPLLDKSMIRELGESLYSADLSQRKWHIDRSGGSTGEPVVIVQDAEYGDRSGAAGLVSSHLMGMKYGKPELLLWGSVRDIVKGGGDIQQFLRRVATNVTTVNAFRMTEDRMRYALSLLERRPPQLIVAYAQAIYELARYAERNSIPVRRQRAVAACADTLHPFMREVIERVFGCPVYNRYGARETGLIACEIPGYQGLWINPWTVHVEIVDPSGAPVADGVEGEIVVTSMANFAMPLIRYRIGDRGVLAPPGSGPHPLASRVLERVTGRTNDVFRVRDGGIVAGQFFIYLMYLRPWVRAFQVVQKSVDWILFRVVLEGADFPPEEWAEICSRARSVFGSECRIDLEIVDEIPALPSGKYRYTISEVE